MSSRRKAAEPDLLTGIVSPPGLPAPEPRDAGVWLDMLREALVARSARALGTAELAVRAHPTDPDLLLLAALTAVAIGEPERALGFLRRYGKRYQARAAAHLLTALALSDQHDNEAALALLKSKHIDNARGALGVFVGPDIMHDWLRARLRTIKTQGSKPKQEPAPKPAPRPPRGCQGTDTAGQIGPCGRPGAA